MQFAKSVREPLDVDFRIGAEVDKKPKPALGDSQVVEELCPMFVAKLIDGLELDNDLIKAEQVGYVSLLNGLALVENRQFFPGLEGNATQL